MPFTTKDFPGRVFSTVEEWRQAQELRKHVEQELALNETEDKTQGREVVATIMPAPKEAIERRVVHLEKIVDEIITRLEAQNQRESKNNKDGLAIGAIFRGESKGIAHTLEVLEEGYLCENGDIYPSLSAAAEGVSGNRRSGWVFWTDIEGTPVGALTGRFDKNSGKSQRAT